MIDEGTMGPGGARYTDLSDLRWIRGPVGAGDCFENRERRVGPAAQDDLPAAARLVHHPIGDTRALRSRLRISSAVAINRVCDLSLRESDCWIGRDKNRTTPPFFGGVVDDSGRPVVRGGRRIYRG